MQIECLERPVHAPGTARARRATVGSSVEGALSTLFGWLGWQRGRPSSSSPNTPCVSLAGPEGSDPVERVDVEGLQPAHGAVELERQVSLAAFDRLLERLEQVSERMTTATEGFAHRVEHASQNLLQSVEGMRAAAADLRSGTAGIESHLNRLESMYERIGAVAGEVSQARTDQKEQMESVTGRLYGITESLTSVVACANEAQQAVARVSGAVADSTGRLELSVEKLVGALESRGGGDTTRGPSAGETSVTLRQVVEVQRQFINTLDDRLSRLTPGHSSSSSSSASSSSSSSSSAKGASLPRTPSAQVT